MTVDAAGEYMYVADLSSTDAYIRKIALKDATVGDKVSTLWTIKGGGHVDGPVGSAQIDWIRSLTVDANGNIYLVEQNYTGLSESSSQDRD